MIFGSYPCCNGPLALTLPDETPILEREICPHCGVKVWHLLCRVGPQSWIESEFFKEYQVDEATKTVRKKREII